MYNDLYVLKYNNYYNREIKAPLPNVTDYQNYLYASLGQTNFNPNDGVSTHHDVTLDIDDGDYLIVATGNSVVSRWFIVDHSRICRGQSAGLYRLQLLRDVIADNYNATLNSTCFIERAIVDDDNPLIYNSENINTNQQRKSAELLKDDTKMAWLVGFVNREAEAKTISINSTVVPDFKVDSLDDWAYYKYVDHTLTKKLSGVTRVYVRPNVSRDYQVATFTSTQVTVQTDPNSTFSNYFYNGSTYDFKMYLLGNKSTVNGKVTQSIPDYFADLPDYQNNTDFTALLNMQGKIIQVGTNTFYKIDYDETPYSQETFITEDKGTSNLYTTLQGIFKGYDKYVSGNGRYKVTVSATKRTLKLTAVVEGEYTIDYPAKTGHLINKNAPFDVFYIPYSDDMSIQVGTSVISANKQFALSIASELRRTLAGDCYDIQLLPYTSMTGYTVTGKLFDINSTDTKRYTPIKKGTETVYWMFWSTSNEKSFTIQHTIPVLNKKVQNQCEMYRLCSPNYNGQYEFSVAKNDGVDYFNVDITYLPVSSYIHVAPNLKGLYGEYSDNGPIGLICKGEFSITSVTDQYIQFMQNNKNYENIFRAEIATNDKSHEIQVHQERIANWLGAAATGVQTGAFVGGVVGVGMGIGAGLLTGIAGESDINYGNELYELNKKYKQDVHNYQLDNIKAMPNSLSKVTAYTKNNQLFPVLERYDATDKEKEAVAQNVIDYSMNVGVIGKPQDYIDNEWSYNGNTSRGYFKAQLIKIDLNTYHESDAISTELARGVYFK